MSNYVDYDNAVELFTEVGNKRKASESMQESLLKDTVGWTGKNRAYSQTNNAVIAHIENGITYDVSWTGSATVTLKKNSASGATITSGSTSPLSFTADADYELYFGSSAAVTNIMVKDSRITDPTYEPYHESVEEEITEIDENITSIKDYIGYADENALGVQVDYDNSTFKRLGAAVGKSAGTTFNAFNMYDNRKRCTVADNGTINHYYGDSGYAEDGTDGQVMVKQPKFYYRVAPIKLTPQSDGHGFVINKANYYISDVPRKGFKLHPAFIDGGGKELDYYLIGAYDGCLYDTSASAYITNDAQVMDNANDKFSSIAGVKPASGLTQDLTRPKIEQMCQNRGSRWHALSMQIASAEQMLMLIEYASFDMQRTIGKGVVDFTDDGTNNMSGTTGSTSSLGNASGRASSTSFTVAGTTTTETVDGKTSVSYRGVENPYGNIWKFVMGMNVHGNGAQGFGVPYICTDYNYQEAKITDNYVSVGFHLPNGGWVKNMGYGNPDLDWAFLPATIGGNNALPVGDYIWGTQNLNGDSIAVLGASWASAWNAGAFAWNVYAAVGYRYRDLAGRLIRLPEAVG